MVAAQISRLAAAGAVRTVTSKNLDADVFIRNISPATYLLKLTHCIKLSFRHVRTRGSNQGEGKMLEGRYIYIYIYIYIVNTKESQMKILKVTIYLYSYI